MKIITVVRVVAIVVAARTIVRIGRALREEAAKPKQLCLPGIDQKCSKCSCHRQD